MIHEPLARRFLLIGVIGLAFGGCGNSDTAARPVGGGNDTGNGNGNGAGLPPSVPFRHPGVLNSKEQLDFVKSKIAEGADPWKSAFERARSSRSGALSYVARPVANVVCGPYSNPDVGCSAEKNDVAAAYTHALLWYFTGDESYALKSIEIMNAWSAVLEEHTNSNAPLQSGWCGSVFPRAAEIIRHTYSGWAAADVDRFASMLRRVYLPVVIKGSNSNGNWELSMAEAAIAISVFLDDRASFDQAVSLWRGRVPAYLYLKSDGPGPVPPPGRSAANLGGFWYGQTVFEEDGVGQETCRDLIHMQYGLAAMINFAETALVQGVDLYAMESRRIAAGLEFHAQFLDGVPPPAWLCGGQLTSVSISNMWEIAFNHYANRLGMPLPHTGSIALKKRPTAIDHHMQWETLTHAQVGAVGIRQE